MKYFLDVEAALGTKLKLMYTIDAAMIDLC